jgi:acyl-coenzyme A thioesterase PaaI-like protein
MTIDSQQVAAGMLQAVPFARTLGIEFGEIAPDGQGGIRAEAWLPDQPATHNHVAGPHAGAIFTLAETASGAVVFAGFSHVMNRGIPLAVSAEVAYKRLAMGRVKAVATLGRPVDEVIAELDAGERPEFPVRIEVTTGDGKVCTEMAVLWTLRPPR